MEEHIIPIDDAIDNFLHHLETHDRTILSARFGDGKSFFLSHFMEDETVKQRYTFLTIFPVSYQVTTNRDIFELIKRDILLQMLLKGIIETDIEINVSDALALYLQCQPLSFIESFLPLLSELTINEETSHITAAVLTVNKFLNTIKKKIDEVTNNSSKDNEIDRFLKEVEQNPIVGQDAISRIINHSLDQYREKYPNKQVVLIIEDLDRIDPAHLFRILNIFSAHIDFCYSIGNIPNGTLVGNKFGLDKVVLVMDYLNVQNIYSHFYGSNTSFEGYIEKFCSSNYFSYSLKEQCYNYYMSQITEETGLGRSILDHIIKPEDFNDKSIRKVVNAINDNEGFVKEAKTIKNNEGVNITLHQGILKLIALLRKLLMADSEIIKRLSNAITANDIYRTDLFSYLAPYLNIAKHNNPIDTLRFRCSTDHVNTLIVNGFNKDGSAICKYARHLNFDETSENRIVELLNKVILMVAK